MYKNVKIFQVMKKEAEKEKKAARGRIKDSKDKEEEEMELAGIKVGQTVQQQIRDFKVCANGVSICTLKKFLFMWIVHEAVPSCAQWVKVRVLQEIALFFSSCLRTMIMYVGQVSGH